MTAGKIATRPVTDLKGNTIRGFRTVDQDQIAADLATAIGLLTELQYTPGSGLLYPAAGSGADWIGRRDLFISRQPATDSGGQ